MADANRPRPRTVVITGATSGIGRATARRLSAEGARVVIVGRDPARTQQVADELDGPPAPPIVADLTTLSGMRAAAAQLQSQHPRVDVLINNAGAVYLERRETEDGHERTMALNLLAPYVLARLLEPVLGAAAPARVVNVSSAAHVGARLPLDDLDSRQRYRGLSAYSTSKLALVLVTRAFARRAPAGRVAHFALHPGLVRTRWGRNNRGPTAAAIRLATGLFGISPERSARTLSFAATSPQLLGRTGEYISHRQISRSSRAAMDEGNGERLWSILAGWSGLPA